MGGHGGHRVWGPGSRLSGVGWGSWVDCALGECNYAQMQGTGRRKEGGGRGAKGLRARGIGDGRLANGDRATGDGKAGIAPRGVVDETAGVFKK